MRPEPPHLGEAATEWSAREVRWIVENGIRMSGIGIRMSGMPAFGAHEAEGLAAMTAFVQRLPGLSSEHYAAMTEGRPDPGALPSEE